MPNDAQSYSSPGSEREQDEVDEDGQGHAKDHAYHQPEQAPSTQRLQPPLFNHRKGRGLKVPGRPAFLNCCRSLVVPRVPRTGLRQAATDHVDDRQVSNVSPCVRRIEAVRAAVHEEGRDEHA